MKPLNIGILGLILLIGFVAILQGMTTMRRAWEGFQNPEINVDALTGNYLWSRGDGQKRYKEFRPYLAKREFSSRNQVDNHEYPINSEMNGALIQDLNKPPVAPCS
jgi:hypothetical protein